MTPFMKHRRRSLRLRGYDYTREGIYFITVVTRGRDCVFGDVVNGTMKLNEYGNLVEREWLKTAELRPNVTLDQYVVMPNHVHGLIVITDARRGTLQRAPTGPQSPSIERFGKPVSNSIPTIVRLFKSTTTKQINIIRNTYRRPIWQRNYYERVIRNDRELSNAREYIMRNPACWDQDKENPGGKADGDIVWTIRRK